MIESDNVALVPLEEEHLENTRQWANDPALQERILRYTPVNHLQQQNWYRALCADKSKIVFALINKQDASHVGNTGFYHLDGVNRRAELWILIGDKDFLGKGLGGETVVLLLKYGFESLNLNKIYLHVDKENTPAVKCYQKCGFVEEGCLRQHYFINGRYKDLLVMSFLRNEYND